MKLLLKDESFANGERNINNKSLLYRYSIFQYSPEKRKIIMSDKAKRLLLLLGIVLLVLAMGYRALA